MYYNLLLFDLKKKFRSCLAIHESSPSFIRCNACNASILTIRYYNKQVLKSHFYIINLFIFGSVWLIWVLPYAGCIHVPVLLLVNAWMSIHVRACLSVSLSVCCAACLSFHQVYRVQRPALPSTCSLMHSRWSVAVRLRLVLPVPLPAPATDGVNKARPTSSLALCLIRLTRGAPCGSLGSA